MKKNSFKFGRRDFVKAAALSAGVCMIRPARGWSEESIAQSSVATLVTREPGRLEMLALTDLHFFEGKAKEQKDGHTLEDLCSMLKIFNPEMMVVDGDIWYEDNFGKGFKRCQWSCDRLGELGVPWAFVWGNHDTSEDHRKCHKMISGAANSLYRGALYDGSYRIEIVSPGESEPFWELIIVNDAMPESGFQQDQVKWFNAEVERIRQKYPSPPPAFVFCHVPLVQFKTIVSKGLAKGVKNEMVNFEKGVPEAFDAIKKSDMVKAVFCGHDHYNNYGGEMDGVYLQYLRATGYAGYGGDKVKKGGTLITIDAANAEKPFEAITVFADGTTWELKDPL